MANFIFLSLDGCDSIKHAKISVKFDNKNKGKARISFRIIFALSEINNDSGFYILIKNDRDPVKFLSIDWEYNKYLKTNQFIRAAGAYGLKLRCDLRHCTVFTIEELRENPELEKVTAIHPNEIACVQVHYKDCPDELRGIVKEEDILLEIKASRIKKIQKEISSVIRFEPSDKSPVYIIQFRIEFDDFIPKETLEYWKRSNESWSVDFDIHKERGYEGVIEVLETRNLLRYPDSAELWFKIPHSHQFVASSPVYEKAFRLKPEDIGYKTEVKEVGEFETQEGDYAVKIVNRLKHFIELSIICTSPFLPGEKPQELKEKIEEFESKEPQFVTQGDLMYPLGLLVAFLTLVFAIVSIFVMGMRETLQLRMTLYTLIAAAIFFGVSVWGISMLCYLLLSPPSLKEKIKKISEIVTEPEKRIKFLTIGIAIVDLIIIISFIYFLRSIIN